MVLYFHEIKVLQGCDEDGLGWGYLRSEIRTAPSMATAKDLGVIKCFFISS